MKTADLYMICIDMECEILGTASITRQLKKCWAYEAGDGEMRVSTSRAHAEWENLQRAKERKLKDGGAA
jgi:hypothetical protein